MVTGSRCGVSQKKIPINVDKRASEPATTVTRPRQEYLDIRKDFATRYFAALETYDKLVPWGAGGALLLSVTFLEKIAPKPLPWTGWILAGSWALLLASLGTSIWSHFASSQLYSTRIELLDWREDPSSASPGDTHTAELRADVKKYAKRTNTLNAAAGLTLLVGAALLALFAFLNSPFLHAAAPIVLKQDLIP